MKRFTPPPPMTDAEREAAKSRRMEGLLRKVVEMRASKHFERDNDLAGLKDWIEHIASKAEWIFETYAKPD